MQQIKEPAAIGSPSRRVPPRRRIPIPDPEVGALADRIDRLEAVLRQAVRANKEVLRTLDPARSESDAAARRRELAAFGDRVREGLTGVARVIRAELRATQERQDDVRRDVAELREAVESLSRQLGDRRAPERAPVTRLADVRLRLSRITDELAADVAP
ncbi:MAG TPA: hypothetical protein VG709_03510 [Actinomycetota bacterium]|nr:hypothetical protein [Actinomycetota bacterium]